MARNVVVVSDRSDCNKLYTDEVAVMGIVAPINSSVAQDPARVLHKRQRQQAGSTADEADHNESIDDLGNPAEKKRRLTADQVKFLEMSFKQDLKLEPERKGLIAKQLGLRPRQVAIWFQNKRARWKNKQVEQDYEALKTKYDEAVEENMAVIKQNEAILEDNKRLKAEVDRLVSLLQAQNEHGIAEAVPPFDTGGGVKEEQQASPKSELTSPTKSSENQSELNGSEQSYATSSEATANDVSDLASLVELHSGVFECPGVVACLSVKPEIEFSMAAAAMPEELFGNFFNPLLFQELATTNGVVLEEYPFSNLHMLNWEEQFYEHHAYCG